MSLRWNIPICLVNLIFSIQIFGQATNLPWRPLIESYCLDCHDTNSSKGDVNLELALGGQLLDHSDTWERAVRQMKGRIMPPNGKDRPTEAELIAGIRFLEAELDRNAEAHPDSGRTDSLRRLTRTEYGNAIRDLLAVDIDVKTLLPPDSSSHGFDNITLSDLSPALLNRYISAAGKISRLVLGRTGDSPHERTIRLRPDITREGHVAGLPLGTRGGTVISHNFPRTGNYEVRVYLTRDRDEKVEGLHAPHTLEVLLNGKVAASFTVNPPENRRDHTQVDAHLHRRFRVEAGTHELGVTWKAPPADLIETLRQPYESAFNQHRHPRRSPAVYQVSIAGPFDAKGREKANVSTNAPGEIDRHHLFGSITGRDEKAARRILQPLLRRAWRGHATEADLETVMTFYRETSVPDGFEAGLEAALAAILVSPKFFIRVERDPADAKTGTPYPLTDLELASRLAFFLWSSLPDEPLLHAAEAGMLQQPSALAIQAKRMLKDPRADSLVKNFASQWLYLRNLDSITPDARLFPDFDHNLRQAMRRETEMLFEEIIRENLSVLHLLRSDYTFLNQRLAVHYGIPHVLGERFRKVPHPKSAREGLPRGGLLRHASILTVTSYANRTSPVLRGHWVMKNLLGTPPPPPPPNTPALEDNTVDAKLPVRDRLAAHRENPVCASCHDTMDPIGFAFEHYDAVGRWRLHEEGLAIDDTGRMPGGEEFSGLAELEQALLDRPEQFVGTLSEKLLTFALGRGIRPSDAPAIRAVLRRAKLEDYRFSSLIETLVESDPFRRRMPEAPGTAP